MSATDRAALTVLLAMLAVAASGWPSRAQSQWGAISGSTWNQFGSPAWGQYQYQIGSGGWNYGAMQKANEPTGAVLNPSPGAGGKASSIFTPPDTRLLGRSGP